MEEEIIHSKAQISSISQTPSNTLKQSIVCKYGLREAFLIIGCETEIVMYSEIIFLNQCLHFSFFTPAQLS